MVNKLPPKFAIPKDVKAEDLKGDDKVAYEARRDEEARRKDITMGGVAQEALDVLDDINARNGSSSEVFTPLADGTQYGYSLRLLKAAIAERERIKGELRVKPSKDVASEILDVSAVMTKYDINEFKAEVIPE